MKYILEYLREEMFIQPVDGAEVKVIEEYASSDVIKTVTKYPNIEFEPDNSILLGGSWVVNGYVEVVDKHIECPICKAKIKL